MSNRRKTPGLMNDLLSGKKSPPAKEEPETARQNTSLPAKQQPSVASSKPQKTPSETPSLSLSTSIKEEDKVKVTFYVTEDIQYDLDVAQLKLRRLAPKHIGKQQLSKSALVEAALRITIDNLEANGENSVLAQYLFA